MTRRALAAGLGILLSTVPAAAGQPAAGQPAAGQQTPADVISFLVTNRAVQTGDFEKDQAAAEATARTIGRGLLVNLATVPIQTSSSGFVYRLDPELGTVTRVSDSFGTFFVERADTSGRGRLSFGAAAGAAGYDRLDGLRLRDGSLVTTANQFDDEAEPFDTESLTLRVSTRTMTLFAAYGLTDRLDIGGALPFVQLHVEGSRHSVYRGTSVLQASGEGNASGLADAAVRVKYRIASGRTGAVAAAGEFRLPTGDGRALLGAGRAAVRMMAIASAERGRAGVHGNAALVFGGASKEIDVSGAFTGAVTPRVTVAGELLVRRVADLHPIAPALFPHPSIAGVETLRLIPGEGGSTLSNAVAGVKWNAQGAFVISTQVGWRLGNAGLTAPFALTIAADYLF